MRGPLFVDLVFVDGGVTTEVEVPLPTLDAAFVLKAALVESGVRMRPDRLERDRVDAVMLAAACLTDEWAVEALAVAGQSEARRALRWLDSSLASPESRVARSVETFMRDQHGTPGGAEWAVSVAQSLARAVRTASGRAPA
jgi:hypothetical protein